jgi:hypothetical protein
MLVSWEFSQFLYNNGAVAIAEIPLNEWAMFLDENL